jgi:hypothetical protein
MQARLFSQKFLDLCASVNLTTIPNDKDMSPQMPQEMTQKSNHFQSTNIVLMKSCIKPQPASCWRNRQNANNRYFVTPVTMPQNRGLANGSPCPTDVWNQQEPAFIEKTQMGPKLSGLFLYVARLFSSTVGYFLHPVVTPSYPASGNSNLIPNAIAAKLQPTYSRHHTLFQSAFRFASRSTILWDTRQLQPHSTASFVNLLSAAALKDSVGPIQHVLSNLASLFSDESGSSGQCCLKMPSFFRQLHGMFCPCPTKIE